MHICPKYHYNRDWQRYLIFSLTLLFLYALIDSSFWFDTLNYLGWSISYIKGCYNFQIKIVFLSLKMIMVLANSVEPDEMPHYAAFHLCLHCKVFAEVGIQESHIQ